MLAKLCLDFHDPATSVMRRTHSPTQPSLKGQRNPGATGSDAVVEDGLGVNLTAHIVSIPSSKTCLVVLASIRV